MARTKKLTDYTYSPTKPASEDAIRQQIDDSIQEVYDDSVRNGQTVNVTGDQTIAGIKTFSSSPIVPTPTTLTQVANKAYVDGVAISATIPLDSLTNNYLAPDVKVGSLADLDTTDKTSVTSAINEVVLNVGNIITDLGIVETDLNIIRTAKTTTGTASALAVDTDGTFDMTRNGNTLTIIPNVTNTGAMTIAVDGQTAKSIKKFNIDTDLFIDVEAEDIKKNTPTPLVRDTVNDFFVYAPKGGKPLIESIQHVTFTINSGTLTNTKTITSVDWSRSVIANPQFTLSSGDGAPARGIAELDYNNSTQIKATRQSTTDTLTINCDVIQFNNKVTVQKINLSTSNNTTQTITPVSALTSALIFSSWSNQITTGYNSSAIVKFNTTSQLAFNQNAGSTNYVYTAFVADFHL